jgi:2-C-methyl-D-erythritol 4-phosphate cytidylyltransferase
VVYHATSIVVAGGSGTRMGSTIKKQYLMLSGKPLLIHALDAMEKQKMIANTVVVVPAEDVLYLEEMAARHRLKKVTAIVPGGDTRGASVYCGLQAVPKDSDLVVVHDGARPFLSQDLLQRLINTGWLEGAAIAAVPVKDTIKQVDGDQLVDKTLNRDQLWIVQTPQVFYTNILKECYQRAFIDGLQCTDDAGIAEAYGYKVKVVLGEYRNIKITTKEDLAYANWLVNATKGVF